MSEKKIRQIAKEHGYSIRNNYRRYLYNNAFVLDDNGEKIPGYDIFDYNLGCMVWGCYDEVFSGLFSWDDCKNFVLSL